MARFVLRNGLTAGILQSLKNFSYESFSVPRLASSWSGSMTDLSLDEEKGYATLTMKNPAGNALATPMVEEMKQAIADAEKSKCRGLVLTSSIKNIFCSGLNLMEFGGPGTTEESVHKYYGGFQDLWFQLYKTPLITVAAMNGHAIAGGCALGMACDYRIFATPKFGIGMNEILFGVPIPYPLLDVMITIMGQHQAAKAAMLAKIHKADEAMNIGLVDEICPVEEIEATAEKVMKQYLKGNASAQIATKMDAKQNALDSFPVIKEKDLKRVVGMVTSEEVRRVMLAYVQSVTKGKK